MANPVTSTEQAVSRVWEMANYSDKLSLSDAIAIYRDNWREQIKSEIDSMFDSQDAKNRLFPLITTEINTCKAVIEKTSLVYKQPAIRWAEYGEVETEDGETEGKHLERYEELVEESQLDHVMQAANEYTRLVNHVLLRPVVRRGKMNVDIILPDNFDIYTDPYDFMDILAIRYYIGALSTQRNISQKVDTRESVMWVKRTMVFVQDNSESVIQPGIYTIKHGQPSKDWRYEENPYYIDTVKTAPDGSQYTDREYVLPFVLTHKDHPIDQLLNFSNGSSIAESAVMFAVLMTMQNEIMKYQAYKILVFSSPNDVQVPDGLKIGPNNLLKAPNGGNITAVDFQAAIREYGETVLNRISMAMAQQGIPPSAFTLTGQPQSGYSLKIDRSSLMDIRDKEIPNYRRIEAELFEMMRIVNNHSFGGNGEKEIPTDAEFHIDFAEMRFDPSPDEQMRKDTFDLSNNLVTPVDLIMRDNPDLSEDDAMALWMKNKAITTAKVAAPLRQPGKPPIEPVEPAS